MAIDIQRVRAEFPSLHVKDDGKDRIYFDNPGGTQVVNRVIDHTIQYLSTSNSNCGGSFRTSIETDKVLNGAHDAMAAFLNAESGKEIIFGQNMTSLTFSVSRSIGRTLAPGDEIVVTRMDHDANVSPWLMMAEDRGVTVRWLDFDPSTFHYDYDSLDRLLGAKTRLVAVNHASNAIGTINDIRLIAARAHAVGALVFVDSVQYAPHAPIDVKELDCDFLVCSAYKFFGPHQGMLWGRTRLLESLQPYKVRPADDGLPHRFETGTLSHEGLAGTLGALEYLEWIGQEMGEPVTNGSSLSERTRTMHEGMTAIKHYEVDLSRVLIAGLKEIEGLTVYGLTAEADLPDRVPTVSFTLEGYAPREVTDRLAAHNIFAWDGHYYAVEVIQRLGLEATGGMVRVGLAHYNTIEEVESLLDVLTGLANR